MRFFKIPSFVLGCVCAALMLLLGPTVTAQFQVSGNTITLGTGAAVIGHIIADASSAVIGHVIVDTAPTTAVTGTFWQATQPVSGTFWQATQPVSVAAAVKVYQSTACGATVASQALLAVPTSSTAVFVATTCLETAFFENSNGSAQTVTLTDNAGTPLNAVGPAFSIPALSNMVLQFNGIQFTSGVKWAAGGTGVLGGMIGYQ